MNNKTILGVTALVVIAVVAWLLMGRGADDAAQTQTDSTQRQSDTPAAETADEPATQATSLKDLMTRGDQKCTYSYADAQSGGNISGTVYLSGGKVRMDNTSTVEGQAVAMHSIVMDNTYYTWIDGQTQYAMKMKFDPATGQAQGGAGDDGQGVNWSQQYNYDCDSWSPDQAMFTLPAGVTFNDLSAWTEIPAGTGMQ